jgi:hypothetical protein
VKSVDLILEYLLAGNMFWNSTKKLEDAQFIFDYLKKAGDAPSFRALFNSFLNSARAITNALLMVGCGV